jgi:hypothetical protein
VGVTITRVDRAERVTVSVLELHGFPQINSLENFDDFPHAEVATFCVAISNGSNGSSAARSFEILPATPNVADDRIKRYRSDAK